MPSTAGVSTERGVLRRRARRAQPLAAYLAQFAAGILAPVLAITGYLLIEAAGRERADALHDARTVARRISAAVEMEIQKAIAVARTLGAAPSLADGNLERFDVQARTVAAVLGGVISVRDASGRRIPNTVPPPDAAPPRDSDPAIEADRSVARTKAPMVSDLLTAVSGRRAVMIDTPVLRDGEAMAFISVSLFPERLVEIIRPGLPEGWIAGIVGRDGRLIARNRDLDRFIGTANPAFLANLTGPEGDWTGVSRDGVPIVGFYIRSALSGWVTSVAVPRDVLRAPERRAIGLLLVLTAAALAGSLGLGWWFSGRIAQPIRRLVSEAARLGGESGVESRDATAPGAPGPDASGSDPGASGSGVPGSGVREVQMVTTALRAASDELRYRAIEADRSAEAIRQNEERLQLVQETAGIGTVDWDFLANRAVGSPRFHEMFGLEPGRPLDLDRFLERVHPADRPRIARERARLRAEGGPFEEEYRILDPDSSSNGGERWIHTRGRMELRNGRPARLLAAHTDVSARKRDERALLASEARFRGTFENAAVGVAHVAFDGRLLLVNRRICDILGYGPDDLLETTLDEITHPDDRDSDRTQWEEMLIGEIATYGVEKRTLRADGAVIWCAMTVSLQRDLGGTPQYFIATLRDITARRQTQEDLRERLAEIEALYDNTPIGLSLIDRDRRFLRVNRALADMNNLPAGDHIGRDMREIVPALMPVLDPLIQRVLDTGRGVATELSGPPRAHPDRTRPESARHWREKLYPLRGADGVVRAVGITVEDITEDRRAEAHLRFLMRELSHRSKNLLAVIQGMATQTARGAESVDEYRRRFGERLMGMAASHDLLVNRDWRGVSVRTLVASQLAPFVETDDPRLALRGPDVDLTSTAAEALGMALHELATNSVKYGALRDQAGRLRIAWEVVGDGGAEGGALAAGEAGGGNAEGTGRRFRMAWTERAASPIVPPTRRGFGRIVIERMVRASLNGEVTLDFPPEGLVWRIDAPDTCLAPPDDAPAA